MTTSVTPVVFSPLRSVRKEAGLSQAELAELVDVRQPTISDLEGGRSKRIDLDLLDKLCEVLGKKLRRRVMPGDLVTRVKE